MLKGIDVSHYQGSINWERVLYALRDLFITI